MNGHSHGSVFSERQQRSMGFWYDYSFLEKLVILAVIVVIGIAFYHAFFIPSHLKAQCESRGGVWGIVGTGYYNCPNYGCIRDGKIVPL